VTSWMLIASVLGVLTLAACHQGPTAAETPEQQRFMVGCRPADAARDPTGFTAYCDRF
jgi:hypothetical protein